MAISKGIPVITTIASGLDSSDKVLMIEMGDYENLKREVVKCMDNMLAM
jgi:transposase